MKTFASILCIFAIFTQILLGASFVVHTNDCHSVKIDSVESNTTTFIQEQVSHCCRCHPQQAPLKEKEESIEIHQHKPHCTCAAFIIPPVDVSNLKENVTSVAPAASTRIITLDGPSFVRSAPAQAPPFSPDIGKHSCGSYVALHFCVFIA